MEAAAHPFEYRYRLPFHEVDAAGVAFYGHLFRHAHDAYESFMDHLGLGLDRMLADGAHRLPLVHCEADYLAPIRLRDEVLVRLSVSEVGRTSFRLSYRFDRPDDAPLARAASRHVLIDAASGLPQELPAEMRSKLSDYLEPAA